MELFFYLYYLRITLDFKCHLTLQVLNYSPIKAFVMLVYAW